MNSLKKIIFGNATRIRFYANLSMLLENRVQLTDGLQQILHILGPRRQGSTEGRVAQDCYETMTQGGSFTDGLEAWIPASELALLSAGEASGELNKALDNAIVLIDSVARIKKSLIGAVIYPCVLLTMLSVLLYIIANSLVPKLAAVAPPENWVGAAYLLYLMAEFSTHYGLLTLSMIICSVVGIVVSFPYVGGRVRIVLDKVQPWKLYKIIHGSIFLLNISMLLRAGVKLQTALETLYIKAGSPWLSHRIEAIMYGISNGLSLGEAMDDSPYTFPDRESISYMQLLCSMQGFEQSLGNFAAHWLEKTVAKVTKMSSVFLLASVLCMGSTLGIVVMAISGIESAIQQSVS